MLVLGGNGSVGRIAVQAALAQGAASVVGTVRDQAGADDLDGLGARAVDTSDLKAASTALEEAADGGFDLVVDTLWGDVAALALEHMATGGQFVQVGNAASPTADITAPAFRNRAVTITGHSNFLVTPEDRADAYTQVAELARAGSVTVSPTTIELDALPETWADLSSGQSRGKVVVLP